MNMKDSKKKKKSKKKVFRTIEEVQKELFPNSVGKICPHCGSDISNKESKSYFSLH